MNANLAFHALQGVAVSTFDGKLADQWRHAHSTLDEALRCIKQYRRVVECRNERLSTGGLVHRPEYVTYAEGMIAFYVKRYRRALRTVTEAEIEMDFIGMQFARSEQEEDRPPRKVLAYLVHEMMVPRTAALAGSDTQRSTLDEKTEWLYPASRADDAISAARTLRATLTPLVAA